MRALGAAVRPDQQLRRLGRQCRQHGRIEVRQSMKAQIGQQPGWLACGIRGATGRALPTFTSPGGVRIFNFMLHNRPQPQAGLRQTGVAQTTL
jgi:hypothetical protein